MTTMWKMIGLALSLTAMAPAPAAAQVAVDLELILMADGSGSIDDFEFALQRGGYARALRDARVINAIRSDPLGKIALAYVEWSGPELQVEIVPWTVIREAVDIVAIARELERSPRELHGGGTALGDAILYAARSLDENKFAARRRVIDISGDGPDRNGLDAVVGRDAAVKRGITVNGLLILFSFARLDIFFRENVIGGPGAFLLPTRNFEDIEIAILGKLIREIAGRSADDKPGRLAYRPATVMPSMRIVGALVP